MDVKQFFGGAMIALSMASTAAFAHHHDLGSASALYEDAQELNQAVSYSGLRYNVKSAVYRFVADVSYFNRCVPPEPEGLNHHHDIPPQCRYLLNRVRTSFSQVDYYLSDAYEYPQVYQSYQETREALYAIEG